MSEKRKLTILHSNDMHGDFFSENVDDKLIGGVSYLSGYINKVREEEDEVLYMVAGDMFRGSIIDSEFLGLSTIEIMNALGPDVVAIGNHEVDYGLTHLLFIEKCARFPVVNANLYIRTNASRLFSPYKIFDIDGMKVLVIGILTEEVLSSFKKENVIGTIIDTTDAAREVEKIVNAHASIDIDFTVLLTHIGFEEDKQLAMQLSPDAGVDIIIGGHSHTLLEKPEVVNGIPIVQAGTGTDHIGRFDIVVDTEKNRIESYTWQCIEINDQTCERDEQIEKVIQNFKSVTDDKYSRVGTRLWEKLTHPSRTQETSLGNMYADIIKDRTGADIVFIGSGSIRTTELGPIVTLGDLNTNYPYEGSLYLINIDGHMLRDAFMHIFRDEAFKGHTEFYQINKEVRVVYNKANHMIESLTYNGVDVKDDDMFKVVVQDFHFASMDEFLDISQKEYGKYGKARIICTSDVDLIHEYMAENQQIYACVDGRMTIKDE